MIALIKIVLLTSFITFSLYAQTLEKVSLQLQWKHQFQFAGYYIAKEKGFYEDVGLDVAIKESKYGMNTSNEVLANKSTFGVGRSTIILDRSQGDKIVALAAIYQSTPNVLIAKDKPNLQSINDFKGKRLMVSGDALEDASVLSMLFSNGIKLEDLKIYEHTFNLQDLIDNKVDLMSAYSSNEPFIMEQKGIKAKVFQPQDYEYDFYNDILFTSENNLYENYKMVKDFTVASLRGWEYAFAHIDESVDLILQKYNTQNKSRDALLFEAKTLKKLAYHNTKKIGKLEKEKFEKIYEYYRLMGLTDKKVNLDDFVYGFHQSKFYLNNSEKEYLQRKEVLQLCLDSKQKLFKTTTQGVELFAIASDYMRLMNKNFEIQYEIVPKERYKERCDATFLAELQVSKDEKLNYTQTFLNIPVVIVTKVDVGFVNTLKDLNGKKIGVSNVLYNSEIFQKFKSKIDFFVFEEEAEALKSLHEGKIYAYIGFFPSLDYALQIDYLGKLKISGGLENGLKFRVAVAKENADLLSIFEKAMNNITNEEANSIVNKWLSIRYIKRTDYTLVLELVAVFVSIFFVVVFFYRKLRIAHEKLELAHKELERLAVTDKLTNIFNRHKLDEILHHETKRSNRDGSTFGVIMIDIDFFKRVNDTYGHNVGDIVLEELSAILMKNSRATDIVGRWGGEEFLIIVPATNKDSLVYFANQLREKVNIYNFKVVEHITISLGATAYAINESSKETVSRADKALYLSKNNGRNQTTYL